MILFNKKNYFLSLSSERLSASRWCSFIISFTVVLGFADLRPISLSPNVARDGTDPSLSWWSFVGLWWLVVASGGVLLKLWLSFVGLWWVLQWVKMRLPIGQDVVAGASVAVTVGFVGEWWLAMVARGCG